MRILERTRRRVLRLGGSVAAIGIAGCLGGPTGGTESPTPTGDAEDEEEELPEGVSEEEFETGPVPEEYRTATSQAGEERDPDSLVTKESVQFQEAADAVEAGLVEEGRDCGNCEEFIPDQNGDGFGACAKVEGYVGAEDWCTLWEAIEDEEGS